jgi:predicted Zn-dependent peptidase
LEAATIADVQAFHDDVPNNATLVLVGDFETKFAQTLVDGKSDASRPKPQPADIRRTTPRRPRRSSR